MDLGCSIRDALQFHKTSIPLFRVRLLVAACKQTPTSKSQIRTEKTISKNLTPFTVVTFGYYISSPPCKRSARPSARLLRLEHDLFSQKYWLNCNSIYSPSLSVSIFRCLTCPLAATFTLRIPNIKRDGTSNISLEKVSDGLVSCGINTQMY